MPVLKPDAQDRHVGIEQMANYAKGLGLDAAVRAGGSPETLEALLGAGCPAFIESWCVRDASDQLGHYRLVVGYDDQAHRFDLLDSLYDPPTIMDYDELYEVWRVFNWNSLVIAPPDHWPQVTDIATLGAFAREIHG